MLKTGLKTCLVVDFPNSTKARKMYLLVSTSDEDFSNVKQRTEEAEEEEDEKEETKANYLSKRYINIMNCVIISS